jgi:hypothetical protein
VAGRNSNVLGEQVVMRKNPAQRAQRADKPPEPAAVPAQALLVERRGPLAAKRASRGLAAPEPGVAVAASTVAEVAAKAN